VFLPQQDENACACRGGQYVRRPCCVNYWRVAAVPARSVGFIENLGTEAIARLNTGLIIRWIISNQIFRAGQRRQVILRHFNPVAAIFLGVIQRQIAAHQRGIDIGVGALH
jgi:hypothetical protein